MIGARTAILDSDVLIEILNHSLERKLSLLFSKVYVPMDVKREQVKQRRRRRLANLFRSGIFHRCKARDQVRVDLLVLGKLDRGESEAIVQAQELNIEAILTNDKKAQKMARLHNVTVLSFQDILQAIRDLEI